MKLGSIYEIDKDKL